MSADLDTQNQTKKLIAKLEVLKAEALADRFDAMVVLLEAAITRLRDKLGEVADPVTAKTFKDHPR